MTHACCLPPAPHKDNFSRSFQYFLLLSSPCVSQSFIFYLRCREKNILVKAMKAFWPLPKLTEISTENSLLACSAVIVAVCFIVQFLPRRQFIASVLRPHAPTMLITFTKSMDAFSRSCAQKTSSQLLQRYRFAPGWEPVTPHVPELIASAAHRSSPCSKHITRDIFLETVLRKWPSLQFYDILH